MKIEGAAHFLQEDRGEQIAEEMLKFLSSNGGSGGPRSGRGRSLRTKPAAGAAAKKKLKPLRALTRKQWEAVGRKAFDRFDEVGLTDRAAALAYYGFLSLFPALIVAIALLALFGSYPETYRSIIDALQRRHPGRRRTRSTARSRTCCGAAAPRGCWDSACCSPSSPPRGRLAPRSGRSRRSTRLASRPASCAAT